MKTLKRSVSLLVALILVLGVFASLPFGALAEDASPTRTIMMFVCASNLESGQSSVTNDFYEIAAAEYDENVNFIIATGGTKQWRTSSEYLIGAEEISSEYNQIWKIEGKKSDEPHGMLTLLEPTGLEGFGEGSVCAKGHVTAFIDYCHNNYPADLYDIIFWDHGGAFAYGYGLDEKDYIGYETSDLIKEFNDSEFIKGGNRFELISFDACLMCSVDLAAVFAEYGDYYLASAESEPGDGHYYTPMMNYIREHPEANGFEIGKCEVDAFTEYYNTVYLSDACLSIVDLKNFKERLLEPLRRFDELLISEATNKGANGRYNFYDELYSMPAVFFYDYGQSPLYDLGALAGAFSAPVSEYDLLSAEQIENYENAYTETALQILAVLNDQDGSGDDVVYTRYSDLTPQYSRNVIIRDLDGEVILATQDDLIELDPTGFSIQLAGPDIEEDCVYINAVRAAIELDPEGPCADYLRGRLLQSAYYGAVSFLGSITSYLAGESETVDYAAVIDELTKTEAANLENIKKCIVDYGGFETTEALTAYMEEIIAQQSAEALRTENVTVRPVVDGSGPTGEYRVEISGTSSQTLASVEGYTDYVLDRINSETFFRYAANRYGAEDGEDLRLLYPGGVNISVPSVYAEFVYAPFYDDYSDSIAEIYQRIYSADTTWWIVAPDTGTCLAIIDKDGNKHFCDLYYYDNARTKALISVDFFKTDEETGGIETRSGYLVIQKENISGEERWVLRNVAYEGSDGFDERASVDMQDEWFRGVQILSMADVRDEYIEYTYPMPVSEPFGIDNDSSDWGITFDIVPFGELTDILRVKISYSAVDLYFGEVDLMERFDETAAENAVRTLEDAEVTAENVVYDGEAHRPAVIVKVDGKTLTENVDYKVIYEPATEIGAAGVYVLGIGDYTGTGYGEYIILCDGEHTFDYEYEIPAECTREGETGLMCSVCGYCEPTGTIPATGHTLSHIEAVDATYESEGNIEYWVCSVCGRLYADPEANEEITDRADVVTAPLAPPKTGDDGIILLAIISAVSLVCAAAVIRRNGRI